MIDKHSNDKSILVIGAGPIVIGQACEFDYSGTQACRVLKEEGYRVILVNSNPATIMTDPQIADATYVEPITVEFIEKIIAKERPNVILPTVGGQTGLNVSLELYERGILKKYGVRMIGAQPEAIDKAENRQKFNDAMKKIGLDVPKNKVVNSLEEAVNFVGQVGFPAVIRPSFTLGGRGGGIAKNMEEFKKIVAYGLDISPTNQVLVDECLYGWKEYEMEVIRDKNDNAIIVCSIENVDPMGIHTGDSITVAPALTLTDKEYQRMRDASIAVLREIGVETGGSNVQFAVNPKDGRMVVIEMNPRVSRSSALASKATGFPIAKVATKLAIGYALDEIQNSITKVTPASFEPSIDYVVTKIPRFTFEKFNVAEPELGTSMRSVGEVMAIGRSFEESLQKALRSLEVGLKGLDSTKTKDVSIIKEKLSKLIPERILWVGEALRRGISVNEIIQITSYDRWFVERISQLVDVENEIQEIGLPNDKQDLLRLKKLGFSDAKLAELSGCSEGEVFDLRRKLGVRPVFKMVDTCAAEFESTTSYFYSCYESDFIDGITESEAEPTNRKKVIILGSGPNRIGQGVEFDYTCVHAALALKEEGIEAIMINCNPETVSTDYDISDRLYFEPLYHEDVLEIIFNEQKKGDLLGVIPQFGGQTPLKLCKILERHNIKIIGTSPDKIDLAEDRERFRELLQKLNLVQPKNTIRHKISDIEDGLREIGYPAVIRPSNVLGGRAMSVIHNKQGLDFYIKANGQFLVDGPILIDKFLDNATEVDVDVISDGVDVVIAGIMEHVEEAGIHSGDSACSIPTITLSKDILGKIRDSSIKLAKSLEIVGLMNIQFAVYRDQLFVLEVNPRASRTIPFVAKATCNEIAKIATKVIVGRKLKEFPLVNNTGIYSFKECVFPFARFDNVDTLLGPEMKSTGEVMGIDKNPLLAFAKAQISYGNYISGNLKNRVLFSVDDLDKERSVPLAKLMVENGFKVLATSGTFEYFKKNGIDSKDLLLVNKEYENKEDNLLKEIENKNIDFIINTTINPSKIEKSFGLRRLALLNRIPYVTTIRAAELFVKSIIEVRKVGFNILSLQDIA